MGRLSLVTVALSLLACTVQEGDGGTPSRRVNEPKLLLTLADGGAARDVRLLGLTGGLAGYLDRESILLWPMHLPVVGDASVLQGLEGSEVNRARVFWQALAIHGGETMGLTAGVLLIDDSLAQTADSPRLGRYLAAWRPTEAGWRLSALFVGGVALPAIGPVPATVEAAGLDLPEQFAEAEARFRGALARNGPANAFGDYLAPEGFTFAGSGELNIGPRMVRDGFRSAPAGATWTMRPEFGEVSQDGALAWTVGELVVADTTAGTQRQSSWNYMLLWARGGKAGYQIVAAATNLRPLHAAATEQSQAP